MVINEKGVVRAMRKNVKEKGYQVGVRLIGTEKYIAIHGEGWLMESMMKECPKTVLAQIVKDCGFLPEPGAAFKIRKELAEHMIADEFWSSANSCTMGMEGAQDDKGMQVQLTGLVFGGSTILMKTRDGKIVPVEDNLMEIGIPGRGMASNGAVLIFNGMVSMVAVSAWTRQTLNPEFLGRINEAVRLEWKDEDNEDR